MQPTQKPRQLSCRGVHVHDQHLNGDVFLYGVAAEYQSMYRARIRDTDKWVDVNKDDVDTTGRRMHEYSILGENETEFIPIATGRYDYVLVNVSGGLDPLTVCTFDPDVRSPPVMAITGVFGQMSTLRQVDLANIARKFARCTTVRIDIGCQIQGKTTDWDAVSIVVRFPRNKRTSDSPFWNLTYLCSRWNMLKSTDQNGTSWILPLHPVYYISNIQAYDTPDWMSILRDTMRYYSFDFRDPMFVGNEYYIMVSKFRGDDGRYEYVDCDSSIPLVQTLTDVVDAETASVIMSWGTCS